MPLKSATKEGITCVKTHSFACKGGKVKNWLSNSSRLSKTFLIKPNGGDMRILDECINYRLGNGMLKKTKYLHNTQKVESVNRTISAHNPRNVTFARNVERRIHTAIQCANEGATGNQSYCPVRLQVPP